MSEVPDQSRFFDEVSPETKEKVKPDERVTPMPSSPLINQADRIAVETRDSLFVPTDDEDEADAEDNGYLLFESQLQAIIPDICPTDIQRLHIKYKDQENSVLSAVNAYYDSADSPIIPPTASVAQKFRNKQSLTHKIAPVAPSKPSTSSSSQLSSSLVSSSARRKKPRIDFNQKELPSNIEWRKFIGSLQVVAWATRPTVKPVEYGTLLTIVKNLDSSQAPKRGRHGVVNSVSSYVKLIQDDNDPSKRKEIGRFPEDVATVLFPLLNEDICDFDATVVFCDGRLSIGDSFIVQLDCYLTDKIFKEGPSKRNFDEDFKQMKHSQSSFNNQFYETPEEHNERKIQVSLVKLFNKLDFKVSTEDSNDTGDKDNEIINIDDESDDDANERTNSPSDANEHVDDMNLNQLKEFYRRTQTEKVLSSLPETEINGNFKLSLRSYQKQGLTWMLRSERELENNDEGELMNPLWKEFKWPKDRSWRSSRDKSYTINPESEKGDKHFYANLYSGEFSLTKPIFKSMCRGGILADEMGLGKTISTLALIHNAPYDKKSDTIEAHTEFYASSTTLIVVPTSLLMQWQDEFLKANNDGSKFLVYYGSEVGQDLKKLLCESDTPPLVVFTTYGTIQNEWSKLVKHKVDLTKDTGLFSVKFFRVVLDEGHNIRNRMTKTTKACYDIQAARKWLLTGTPIINRLDDLYSLVKFLKLVPWSNISYWNTFVTTPFEKKNYKQALDVVQAILEPVLMRRTKNMKKDGKPLVELPSKEVIIERIKFSPRELNLYNWFLKRAESSVNAGIKKGDLLRNYTSILVHILRLRQLCNHMDLIKSGGDEMDEDISAKLNTDVSDIPKELLSDAKGFTPDEFNSAKALIHQRFKSLANLECSICTQQPIAFENMSFTQCGHVFCLSCILEYCYYQEMKAESPLCPNCREGISTSKLLKPKSDPFSEIGNHSDKNENFSIYKFDNSLRSSKLNALLSHLKMIRDTSPNEKVVVFSQFSAYLDIMERELQLENGLRVLKFHGGLSMEKRSEILKKFKQPRTGVTVLLLSLKAGGVGLNLTEASRAFMCDPWWSPSVEDQAIDRIHRIGQNNSVKVVRFIMEGSIEEKMLKIQERKRTIGEAVEAEEEERRKRRVEEIQMLFE